MELVIGGAKQGSAALANYRKIISRSPVLLEIVRKIQKAIKVGANILIEGETGVGKSCLIRYIALLGDTRLVEKNISAIPDNVLEAELFGYEKGSFTGADRKREGLFVKVANGGIIFLDEIGEISLPLQPKLLHVIGDRIISPIGASENIPFKGVCICASNQDLAELKAKKLFREDLYYRISSVTLTIPPLRQRMGEFGGLVNYFLGKINEKLSKKDRCSIGRKGMKKLFSHHWPGNLRELESVLNSAVVNCSGNVLEPEHIRLKGAVEVSQDKLIDLIREVGVYDHERWKLANIYAALKEKGYNIKKAAALFGVSPRAMHYYLSENRIDVKSMKAEISE